MIAVYKLAARLRKQAKVTKRYLQSRSIAEVNCRPNPPSFYPPSAIPDGARLLMAFSTKSRGSLPALPSKPLILAELYTLT